MKRLVILIAVFSLAIASTAALQASAQEAPLMTDEHIARIRANCVEAQSNLRQLHASDALLRVNRGQLYETISTKLMAPLNSRIALNRLDGVKLVATATTYGGQLADFRQRYQQYEESMSQTLKINCTNQPVAFYDSVNSTRTKRQKVHNSTTALHKTIQAYEEEFEVFAKPFEEN